MKLKTAASQTPRPRIGRPLRTVLLITALVVVQLAVVFEVRIAVRLLSLANRGELGEAERLLLVAGIFGLGFLLFRMRYACKATYGLMETLFALAFAHETSTAWQSNGSANLLALGSAVYLVVRGLSNVKDGVEERAVAPETGSRNPVIRFEMVLVALWKRNDAEESAVKAQGTGGILSPNVKEPSPRA